MNSEVPISCFPSSPKSILKSLLTNCVAVLKLAKMANARTIAASPAITLLPD